MLGVQVATAVQVVVVVDVCKMTKARRIMEVRELGPVADGVLRQREIFSYRVTKGQPVWHVGTKVSAFRDKLEAEPGGFVLSALPDVLELPLSISYREAAVSAGRH
jgi:hypothetical protein